MRHPRSTSLLPLFLFCGIGSESPASQNPASENPYVDGPYLEFSSTSQNIGFVVRGDLAPCDFAFQVKGDEDLTITRVQGSCDCAVSRILANGEQYDFGKPLPPGSKGVVRVRMNTYKIHGHKSSVVTVYSNNQAGAIPLRVSCSVRAFFEVSPEYVNLGNVLEGTSTSSSIRIKTKEVPSFEITDWGSAAPPRTPAAGSEESFKIGEKELFEMEKEDFTRIAEKPKECEIVTQKIGDQEWEVTVRLSDDVPVGPYANSLRFQTDAGRAFDLRVSGMVMSKVGIEPSETVAFGLMRAGTASGKEIFVVINDPSLDLKVRSASVVESPKSQHLDVGAPIEEADPDRAGKSRWRVKVTVLESMPSGSFHEKLRIETDHPELSFREVQVTGFLRGTR